MSGYKHRRKRHFYRHPKLLCCTWQPTENANQRDRGGFVLSQLFKSSKVHVVFFFARSCVETPHPSWVPSDPASRPGKRAVSAYYIGTVHRMKCKNFATEGRHSVAHSSAGFAKYGFGPPFSPRSEALGFLASPKLWKSLQLITKCRWDGFGSIVHKKPMRLPGIMIVLDHNSSQPAKFWFCILMQGTDQSLKNTATGSQWRSGDPTNVLTSLDFNSLATTCHWLVMWISHFYESQP